MQPQIIKVNDIEKSIQEVGLKYYVDRLLQDELGDYYWVETKAVESENGPYDECWTPYKEVVIGPAAIGQPDDMESVYFYQYRIVQIPQDIAWFIIDALKLQSDVLGIGSGSYEDGPHGGRLTYYIIEKTECDHSKTKSILDYLNGKKILFKCSKCGLFKDESGQWIGIPQKTDEVKVTKIDKDVVRIEEL